MSSKNALVTGANGFIGSHLCERLVRSGWAVRAFAEYNSFNSWGWLDTLAPDVLSSIDVRTGDIRDPLSVDAAVRDQSHVFHLAALIAIPYSYLAPASYVDTNVTGTLNVLQAARTRGVQRLLTTSTSEVYGTARSVPISEGHVRQAQSPYAASKIGADALAESYWRSFSTPVTIVRPFNTYGPRQSARAVIPTIITQLLDGSDQIQLGSVEPTRDLVYVGDTVEGFERVACCEELVGSDVNIATGTEISIGQLAGHLISVLRPGARIVVEEGRLRPANSGVERLVGDASRLKMFTGWQPGTPLANGLKATIDWFADSSNRNSYKSRVFNV